MRSVYRGKLSGFQKGWGYCGNPSKFSHIGGMGISFSLAASLEAPFAQLLEMLSWMWQSKSHRISHCFRHSVCFLQLRQSWICKTRCVFGVFEGRRIILAESTLASPNSFGQDDESPSSSEIHPQIEIKMISKFDKQLCPPRRPGRVHEIHEAIESKWILNAPWQRLRLFPLMLTRHSAQGPWLLENAEQLKYIKVLT